MGAGFRTVAGGVAGPVSYAVTAVSIDEAPNHDLPPGSPAPAPRPAQISQSDLDFNIVWIASMFPLPPTVHRQPVRPERHPVPDRREAEPLIGARLQENPGLVIDIVTNSSGSFSRCLVRSGTSRPVEHPTGPHDVEDDLILTEASSARLDSSHRGQG